MNDDSLNRLIAALETGTDRHFHGDRNEATLEALKELRALKEWLATKPR